MKSMVRCAGSSLAAVAVEFGLLTLLVSLFHVFYLAGALIAGAVGLLLAFLLNRAWAFTDGRGRRPWLQLVKHSVVVCGGIGLGTMLLWVAVRHLSLPYQVAWLASGSIVFFTWTFPMQRFFTFRAAPALA
jgi:putative flippase GtrA